MLTLGVVERCRTVPFHFGPRLWYWSYGKLPDGHWAPIVLIALPATAVFCAWAVGGAWPITLR